MNRDISEMNFPRIMIGFSILIIGLFILYKLLPFTVIGAGERGVVMNGGKVSDYVMGEGINFKIPFYQDVKRFSVRIKKTERKTSAAANSDQDVFMLVVLNWHLQPNKVNEIYQTIGDEKMVEDVAIIPAIDGVVRAETSKFSAKEILEKRAELEQNIVKTLKNRITENYPISVKDIYIADLRFSEQVNAAIEDKAVAEQEKQRSQILADKALKDGEAKINIASAEATAQRLQQQTLTPLLIQKQFVEALEQGKIKLPDTVVLGNGQDLSNFILNIPQ